MTYQPTAADLAVLREAAEYAGQEQIAEVRVRWCVDLIQRRESCVYYEAVLARPYAADFEAALRERLVADGWRLKLDEEDGSSLFRIVRTRPPLYKHRVFEGHHAHPLLALCYAAERAGAFESKEEA